MAKPQFDFMGLCLNPFHIEWKYGFVDHNAKKIAKNELNLFRSLFSWYVIIPIAIKTFLYLEIMPISFILPPLQYWN